MGGQWNKEKRDGLRNPRNSRQSVVRRAITYIRVVKRYWVNISENTEEWDLNRRKIDGVVVKSKGFERVWSVYLVFYLRRYLIFPNDAWTWLIHFINKIGHYIKCFISLIWKWLQVYHICLLIAIKCINFSF